MVAQAGLQAPAPVLTTVLTGWSRINGYGAVYVAQQIKSELADVFAASLGISRDSAAAQRRSQAATR
jgi:hypothetical protein